MTATASERLMTAEEFLALPDDGKERWLIDGRLYEKPMTYRNRFHSLAMVNIGAILKAWNDQQPKPRGAVLCGEAGCRIFPGTVFGIDVVYISAELATRESEDTTIVDGVPTLAVEILSPSDTQKEIKEKVASYRKAGVPLVWLVDPTDKTVLVYRDKGKPELFNEEQDLTAEPHLPGFRVRVGRFFE